MSDHEFDNYLALLGGMLRLRRTQRAHVAGELRDHLIEHVAHLEASGITHEEAVRRALEEFGDAAALAANFSALVGMRRRRLIMRCTIGTTVVMTGLVVAMLAFRPRVFDDPSLVNAQTESNAAGTAQLSGNAAPRRDSRPMTADADTTAQRKLKEKGEVEFDGVPLAEVLEYLSDRHSIQHYVDKRSLQDAGIAMDAPVTLRLKDVPLDMVLDLLLREHQLGYRLRNGVIMIASEGDVQSQTEVRVYRIPQETADELLMLIPETIEPQSWRTGAPVALMGGGGYGGMGGGMGGGIEASGPGSIRSFRGVLVISQTPEIHQKIDKLLEDLMRTGALDPQQRSEGAGMMHRFEPARSATGAPGYGGAPGYAGAAGQPRIEDASRQTGSGAIGPGGYGSAGPNPYGNVRSRSNDGRTPSYPAPSSGRRETQPPASPDDPGIGPAAGSPAAESTGEDPAADRPGAASAAPASGAPGTGTGPQVAGPQAGFASDEAEPVGAAAGPAASGAAPAQPAVSAGR